MTEPKIIHARIELIDQGDGNVAADITVTSDNDNPAVVLSRWLSRHLSEINTMAQREHQAHQVQPAKPLVEPAVPRLLGPDKKPIQ